MLPPRLRPKVSGLFFHAIGRVRLWRRFPSVAAAIAIPAGSFAAEPVLESFHQEVEPILDKYCYDCHGNGHKKGGVSLDEFTSESAVQDHTLWLRVLKNTRSGIMPPADEDHLPPELVAKLSEWIKRKAFNLDARQPDPGRVTVRRLNRVEYRNTIRELVGVDFDTQIEFPADDTGHGFDNIGDVLTISPMLLEKYLDAAQSVISSAVPTQPRVVAERRLKGNAFATVKVDAPVALVPVAPLATIVSSSSTTALPAAPGAIVPGTVSNNAATATTHAKTAEDSAPSAPEFKRPPPFVEGNAVELSYYTPATVATSYPVAHAGKYQLVVNLRAVENYVDNQFDLNRCRLLFKSDGDILLDREFVRESDKNFEFTFDREWNAGQHELTFEVQPLGPDREQKRLLRLSIHDVTVRGPFVEKLWVQPPNYTRFFPGKVPSSKPERLRYARRILADFTSRAFRRPVDEPTVDRLVGLVEAGLKEPGRTFESAMAQAMTAVLASPRFIFREEQVLPLARGQSYPSVDEYSLASRLSYFLWSSMPDAELFRLAGEGRLRANLPAQIDRMLQDPRSAELVKNFTGQWLQARDIVTVPIDGRAIFQREHADPALDAAFATYKKINPIPEDRRTPEQVQALADAFKVYFASLKVSKPELTEPLREAMQQETQMYFARILREDRSLLELIESNYTFVNEKLAKHYGIAGVSGPAMRLVTLPPNSPRGGVLTQGTVLAVTSNPTRTSPVKRGVFILDSILGAPPAPPPPNIPPLEDAEKDELGKMSLRDTLALHAKNAMCRSCHNRMDPLGLALENFNAMGQWRDAELDQPIAPAGKLITGESFADIRELKHILATKHTRDFYACFSDKMLTYALGRGLEYYDTETLDQLVAQLTSDGGRPVALIKGIINSASFQQRRSLAPASAVASTASGESSVPAGSIPKNL